MSLVTGREGPTTTTIGGGQGGNLSRGLEWLWKYLRDIRRPHVLDCGPVCQSTVEILLRRGSKVYVADLITPLQSDDPQLWDRSKRIPAFLVDRFLSHMPPIREASLTAIFCWQLFDLVPHEAKSAVVSRLLSLLQPTGVLFCLLREPYLVRGASSTWWLESLTTLGSKSNGDKPFPCAPITNREMERLNPAGSVKTFLTRAGIREALAVK